MSHKKYHTVGKLKEKITLYGYRRTLLIAIKAILRKLLSFSWEKCYLMSKDIENVSSESKNDFIVKELSIHDYENELWKPFFFVDHKKQLYIKRFFNSSAKAYGVFIDNELAYSTWIGYGELEITDHLKFAISKKCALLLDSYCHSKFRGKGIHNFMNQWSINEMASQGIKKCYVIVLSFNIPALKTQKKCGLHIERNFYIFNFGKHTYCTLKQSYFNK